jgi:hypothetical protein
VYLCFWCDICTIYSFGHKYKYIVTVRDILLEVGSVWYRNLFEISGFFFFPNLVRLASGLLQFIFFFVITSFHEVLHAVFPSWFVMFVSWG